MDQRKLEENEDDDDVILNEKPPPLVVIDDDDDEMINDDDCSKETYDVYVVLSDKEELEPENTLQNVERIGDEKDDPLQVKPDSVHDVNGVNYIINGNPKRRKYECPVCINKYDLKSHESDLCQKRFREISDTSALIKISSRQYRRHKITPTHHTNSTKRTHHTNRTKRPHHTNSTKQFNCYVCYRNLAMPDDPEKCYFCTTELQQKTEAPANAVEMQLSKKRIPESEDDDEINIYMKNKCWKCSNCDKLFRSRYNLIRHGMTHTSEKPFSCTACNQTFRELTDLQNHYRVHIHEKSDKCDMPSELNQKPEASDDAVEMQLSKKSFSEGDTEINICSNNSETNGNNTKIWKCSYCDKVLDSGYNLQRHEMIHTSEEPFSCTACDQTFRELTDLQNHYRVHIHEKSDKCDMPTELNQKLEAPNNAVEMQLSKKRIPESEDDDEINIYIKKKCWKCSNCDKLFRSRYNLIRHGMTHTSEKPFSCTACDQTFRELTDLQNHYRVHIDEKSEKCDMPTELNHKPEAPANAVETQLSKKSFSKDDTEINISSNNSITNANKTKIWKCPYCDKLFRSRYNLTRHRMTHTSEKSFSCTACDQTFRELTDLQNHYRVHIHEKSDKCDMPTELNQKLEAPANAVETQLSKKSFSDGVTEINICSNNSETNGNNTKIWKCSYCDKVLDSGYNLQRHEMIHTSEEPFSCTACDQTFRELTDLQNHYRVHIHEKSDKCDMPTELNQKLEAPANAVETQLSKKSFSDGVTEINICSNNSETNGNNTKIWKCSYCDKVLDSGYNLQRHEMIHTSEEPFSCTACDQTFRELTDLQNHYRVHTDEKSDKCDMPSELNQNPEASDDAVEMQLSKKSFSEGDAEINISSNNSITNANKTKIWKCSYCDKVLDSEYNLQRHVMIHTGEKPFSCSACPKKFRELSSLKKHCRMHTGEKSDTCDVPTKLKQKPEAPADAVEMQLSRRIFSEDEINISSDYGITNAVEKKIWKCIYCDTVLDSKYNLQRHEMIHTGEKPFSCTTCDQTFRELIALRIHSRLHTGEKSNNHSTHTKLKQNPEAPDDTVEIKLSKKSLSESEDYDEIRISIRKKCWKCTYCKEVFESKHYLKRHVSMQSIETPPSKTKFPCSMCDKTFRVLKGLHRHNQVHIGEKPYECNTCGNLYRHNRSLRRHLRFHDGEKHHKCIICNRNFSSKCSLKRHNMQHYI